MKIFVEKIWCISMQLFFTENSVTQTQQQTGPSVLFLLGFWLLKR